MTETYTATLDRIVDGQTAALLVEEDDETVDVTTLLPAAQHEGAVLEIAVEASERCEAEYLPEVTQSRKESAQARLDRLSKRLSDRLRD